MIKSKHSSLKEILFSQSEPCKQSSRHSERLHGYVFNAVFFYFSMGQKALVESYPPASGWRLAWIV